MVGYATFYTMAPVFSLVLDEDVSEQVVVLFPELYKVLQKVCLFESGKMICFNNFFLGTAFLHEILLALGLPFGVPSRCDNAFEYPII